jgi:hypothetical protein
MALVDPASCSVVEEARTTASHRLSSDKLLPARPLQNWIVVATILVSAFVACWHIQTVTIWYDEAITLLTASGHAAPDWSLGMQQFKPTANLLKIFVDLYKYDVHPPLYFLTLAFWRVLFGSSLEVARSLSLLFTLATLVLLYRYVIAVGLRWPSVPVVLCGVSAASLRYAYNARPYAMATFLIVLTLYLAHRKSPWTGICAAACVATHYFAALLVVPIVLIESFLYWKVNRPWVIRTLSSFTFLCAPLSVLMVHHTATRTSQFFGFGIFHAELHALLKAAVSGAVPSAWDSPFWQRWRYWNVVLYVVALFVLAGELVAIRRRQFTLAFTYIAFLCLFLFVAMVTNKSIIDMPNVYYLGIGAPLLILLIAYGVEAVPLASPLLGAAILIAALTSTPIPISSSPDYRSMVAHIRSECERCAIVAGLGSGRGIPACVLYEAGGHNVYQLGSTDEPSEFVRRIGSAEPIYLIPTSERTTRDVERRFVQSFASEPRVGYFKIDPSRPATNK